MARPEPEVYSRWGFPLAVFREILGVAYFLLGVGLTLALASAHLKSNWMGVAGARTADALMLVFGGWVSYALPGVCFLFAAQQFMNRRLSWTRPIFKVLGVGMLIGSLCALFTLVASSRGAADEGLFAGGIIGAFLTLPQGLGLAQWLGPAGAALVFGGMLVISLLLVSEYLLRDLFAVAGSVVGATYRIASGEGRGTKDGKGGPDDASWWRRFPGLGGSRRSIPKIIDNTGATTASTVAVKKEPRRRPRKVRQDEGIELEALSKEAQQVELEFEGEYAVPPLDLLTSPPKRQYSISEEEILEISARLEQTLREFGVEARVMEVVQGPVVTRFELQPAAGVKVNRISGLEREIAMALLAESVRIEAPIPGKAAIGVEIPNKKMNAVVLREILSCDEFQTHASPLAFGLGKDISGEPMICDLTEMPHLLIAGATGAGKSVCLNSIIISMLMRIPPDRVKFIMIDPKRVELSHYQHVPHLLAPVVVDPRKAAGALSWVIEEMERRYRQLQDLHVRNIGAYNAVVGDAMDNGKALKDKDAELMPYIVVVVDELADLMLVARAEVEENIQRLAQMSRAVGIHLILATQRPSVNVITGVIKANFPVRIAFRVSSKVDSRTILDSNGAEALLGRGDMIYSPAGTRTYRVQGAFVSDVEVERVADMIREQGPPQYQKEDFAAARGKKGGGERDGASGGYDDGMYDGGMDAAEEFGDELYLPALKLVLESRQASVSLIQRRMKIGYARAGRLMDLMQQNGIVGPYQGSKPRDLLVNPEDQLAMLESQGLITRDGFRDN